MDCCSSIKFNDTAQYISKNLNFLPITSFSFTLKLKWKKRKTYKNDDNVNINTRGRKSFFFRFCWQFTWGVNVILIYLKLNLFPLWIEISNGKFQFVKQWIFFGLSLSEVWNLNFLTVLSVQGLCRRIQ